VAIALMGKRFEHYPELARFATVLGFAASGGFALVAFTPLADFWFITVSGLTPELASFALTPTKIMAPLPALSVLLSFQRAIQVQGRRTRPITVATVIEVATIVALFPLFGWGIGMVGVTAAAIAFLAGRTGGVLFLLGRVRRTLRRYDVVGD
jgi:Na+-driven multidrug efflux pump